MRAERILSRWLEPLTDFMHAKRQRALLDVVGALMKGRRLWVTTLGRALPGPAKFKHRIKRVDRLLGNHRSRAVRVPWGGDEDSRSATIRSCARFPRCAYCSVLLSDLCPSCAGKSNCR